MLIKDNNDYRSKQSKETVYPFLPTLVEGTQEAETHSLGADWVIYWVNCHEFEVFQSPVEWHCRGEEVNSAVFVAEFAWVVRADGDWIAETEENRCSWEAEIESSRRGSDEIGDWIEFKADRPAMWQKLNALNDVESMPNTNRASSDSNLDVVIEMVASISSVIAFLVVQIRVFH